MNVVFQKYLSAIGKRYAQCPVIAEYQKTFSFAEMDITFAVTEFDLLGEKVRFFEKGSSGFIAKTPKEILPDILPNHKRIVSELGVISDLFGFTERHLQNISDAFVCDNKMQDINYIAEDLIEKVSEDKNSVTNSPSVNLQDLIPFAYEANGNVFMYNKAGELFLYGMDHSYEDVTCVEGYPAFTLYRISEIQTLDDFIITFLQNFK